MYFQSLTFLVKIRISFFFKNLNQFSILSLEMHEFSHFNHILLSLLGKTFRKILITCYKNLNW